MNTTDNNSNQLSLQELHQRKKAIETKRYRWTWIISALIIVPFALEFILDYFLAEDTVTRLIGITYIFFLLFFGYYVVKVTKWTWAINDVEREIKKVEKQQSVIPEKPQPAKNSFSTRHHTWSEKVAKVFGAFTIIIAICLMANNLLGPYGFLTVELPQSIEDNFLIVSLGLMWIGLGLLQYRSDMRLISRIVIWSSVAVLSVCSLLYFMGYDCARWMMPLVFLLGFINYILIDKD